MSKIKSTTPVPLHRIKSLFADASAFTLAVNRQRVSMKILLKKQLEFYMSPEGDCICIPYSEDNLHQMALVLGLNKFSFKKDRYNIPEHKREKLRIVVNTISSQSLENMINKHKK